MKIQILNRFNGSILFEHDCENNTIKKTVELAILCGANLRYADLRYADLRDVNFRGADFTEADFSYADLRDVNLRYVNFTWADLSYADLRDADLRYVNFTWADLRYVNFSDANFSGANFTGANLRNTKLRNAILHGANLPAFKNDLWAKLLILKNEIPAFKKELNAGHIDGSSYVGDCCCFCGTMAKIKNVHYEKIPGVKADSRSYVEQWFANIEKGDTPENNSIAKLTMDWIEEFEMYLNA